MTIDPDKIPIRIIEVRLIYRFTQEELGRRCGVSKQIISMWERGERVPNRLNWETLRREFPEIEDERSSIQEPGDQDAVAQN